jgi:hypothetical protein
MTELLTLVEQLLQYGSRFDHLGNLILDRGFCEKLEITILLPKQTHRNLARGFCGIADTVIHVECDD